METFLADHRWIGPGVGWDLKGDGTFVTFTNLTFDEVLPSLVPNPIPSGAKRLSGRWQASRWKLRLSGVTTGSGKQVQAFALELNWVDGKYYVDFGGERYTRNRLSFAPVIRHLVALRWATQPAGSRPSKTETF